MEHHPITAFSTRLHAVLDEVLTASAASLSGQSAGDTAVLLAKAEARISALRLRLLEQAAARTPAPDRWRSPRAGGPAQRRWSTVARAGTSGWRSDLSGDFHRTETALAAGEVTAAQAEVIVDAVRALPASVGPEGRDKAELHLLEQAGEFNPRQLKVLARHLIDVIDPDAADERLAAQLAAEERRAARDCSCRSTPTRRASPTSMARSRPWPVTNCAPRSTRRITAPTEPLRREDRPARSSPTPTCWDRRSWR